MARTAPEVLVVARVAMQMTQGAERATTTQTEMT